MYKLDRKGWGTLTTAHKTFSILRVFGFAQSGRRSAARGRWMRIVIRLKRSMLQLYRLNCNSVTLPATVLRCWSCRPGRVSSSSATPTGRHLAGVVPALRRIGWMDGGVCFGAVEVHLSAGCRETGRLSSVGRRPLTDTVATLAWSSVRLQWTWRCTKRRRRRRR